MQGWWCVRYGEALAWVETPSAEAALRRCLNRASATTVPGPTACDRLSLCCRGEDDRPVDPDRETKSVSSEITLAEDIGMHPVSTAFANRRD